MLSPSYIIVLFVLITACFSQTKYPLTILIEGRSVTIAKEPKRLLSMLPNMTELLFSLGAGDKIVGRSNYCNFPNEALAIPVIGELFAPNIEKIYTLDADIALGAIYYKDATIRHLRNANMDVIQQKTPETVAALFQYIYDVGAIINHTNEADSLITDLKQRINEIKKKSAQLPRKPRVYYSVSTGSGGEYTAGNNTYISDLIEICGGTNVAGDITGWRYNIENLLQQDPEIIIGDSSAYNTMSYHPNYKNLTAIRNNNFILIDRNIFSRLGPRLLHEGADQLLKEFNAYTKN